MMEEQVTVMQEPWQLTRAELVPYQQTIPIPRVALPSPKSWSEEDLAAYKLTCIRLETEPPEVPRFPVGTWRLMPLTTGGDWLWHLEEVAFRDLRFVHGDPFDPGTWGWGDIKSQAVEKFSAWIKAGSEPPPIEVWQMQSGRLQANDGHNRSAALVACGRATTLAWVSWLAQTSAGLQPLSHRLAVEAAIRASQAVPEMVLAEYPDLVAWMAEKPARGSTLEQGHV
jgi:hypothetical protein